MLCICHRGYHVSVPENTLAAFEQAVALGVDGIETDVRMSRDGIPILFHDRLAPNGQDVGALDRAELERLVNHPIPRLEEALLAWDGVLWNVEVKTPVAQDPVATILRRFRSSRRLLVTSFWHTVAVAVAELSGVEGGLLVSHRPTVGVSPVDWFPSNGQVRTIVWSYENLDREVVDQVSSHGGRNFVYGVVTPEDHRRVADWALSGVITDRPEYMKSPPG